MWKVHVAIGVVLSLQVAGWGESRVDTSAWVKFTSFGYSGTCAVTPAEGEYLNPIVAGFYPDPTICRVGEDYYLVNSSFQYFPGLPVWHSTDLVNWKQIGNAIDRPSQYPAKGGPVSAGMYAPTLRYHNGTYYIVCTLIGGGGNFYITAKDPAGPWSDPVFLHGVGGMDPSFFFDDDGKCYITNCDEPPNKHSEYNGHRTIRLQEVDLEQRKVVGEQTILVNGGTDLSQHPVWCEAPHLYKIKGTYYLMAAQGGTGTAHSEVVFRSSSLRGPYVPFPGNPMITARGLPPDRSNPVTCTGHADLVETQNGEWFAVFLGCQPYENDLFNTGRETFLLPVTWSGGWPTMLPQGASVPLTVKRPNLPPGSPPAVRTTGDISFVDHFDSDRVGFRWMGLRVPTSDWYATSAEAKALFLEPRADRLAGQGNPSYLAVRQQNNEFACQVTLTAQPKAADCVAGLAAFQNESHYYAVDVSMQGGELKEVSLEQSAEGSKDSKGKEAVSVGEPRVLSVEKLPEHVRSIVLKIEGSGAQMRCSYQVGSGEFASIGGELRSSWLSTDVAGGFQGVTLGVFAHEP